MDVLRVVTSNFVINVAATAWFSAQVLKLLFTLLLTRKVSLERLLGSGGMPSSHSALVCSMTVAVARSVGYASPVFGMAFCFAAVVIYDAMGVRRAAGEQAKVLNKMIFEFPFFNRQKLAGSQAATERPPANENEGADEGNPLIPLIPKELKELLGHTPFEVLGGCILGIAVALLMPMI